jgi:hypothetical protein
MITQSSYMMTIQIYNHYRIRVLEMALCLCLNEQAYYPRAIALGTLGTAPLGAVPCGGIAALLLLLLLWIKHNFFN